ncbi:hypothetical protein [Streptomyces sp. bgisy130]|uniref:hypothetical protein n=1 Tax=Streptomyces sp. bgisy130 TaxID=3413788 RepID=UPI003F4A3E1D
MISDAQVHADTWGTITRTHIRLTDDRSLPAATQDHLIAETDARAPWRQVDVNALP